MSNSSLTISFSNESASSSEYVTDTPYVRLEQKIDVEPLATLGEVAALLEDLYDVNPCTGVATVSSSTETEEPTSVWSTPAEPTEPEAPFSLDTFKDKVSELLTPPACLSDSDGNWSAQVKVILSDPNLPYSLKLTNGVITKTVLIKESYTETIEVSSAKGILLAYPIVSEGVYTDDEIIEIEDPSYHGEIEFKWNGSVITEDGGIVPPPVVVIGNTLYWGIEVSGSLNVTYPTKYFLVDVTVFGTNGDLGDCSAICFYETMVDTLKLEQPDINEDEQDDYCGTITPPTSGSTVTTSGGSTEDKLSYFTIIKTEWKCNCSGDTAYYTYSPEMTKEQRDSGDYYYFPKYVETFGGYVDCGETTGDIATTEFYVENCCELPHEINFKDLPVYNLPQCETVYRKNPGGRTLDAERHAELLEEYGDQLKIVYVTPEDGDCGVIEVKQVLHSLACCDEIIEMTWDENNCVDFIPDNSQGGLAVFDGAPIKTWISNSPGAFFNSQRTAKKIVAGNAVTVYTDEDACGMLGITVDDGCIKLNREIQAETGAWVRTETWTKWLGTPRPEYGDTIGFDDLIDPLTARIIIDGRTRVTEHVDNNYYGDRILGYCYDSNQVCCYGSLSAASGCGEQDEFDCAAIGVPADDTSFDWGPTCRTGGAEPDSSWFDGMYSVAAGHPWGQIARKSALGHICGCEGHQTVCSIGHWYQYVSAYIYVDEWQC